MKQIDIMQPVERRILKFLIIDTSSRLCQVGIHVDGQLCEKQESVVSHSNIILLLIDELMNELDVGFRDLDFIGITRGPGSFTGLRIGVAVAQGLAFSHQLPVLPLSTLQVLAYSTYCEVVKNSDPVDEIPVLALLDARMDQVYGAWYLCSERSARLSGKEQVLSPHDIEMLGSPLKVNEHGVIAGSGLAYQSASLQLLAETCISYPEQGINLAAFSELAENMVGDGSRKNRSASNQLSNCIDATQLVPAYLRIKVVD